MSNSEIELLQAELKCSTTKIETIDMVLRDGTIEQKIDLILSDIRDKEIARKLESERKLKLITALEALCVGISTAGMEDYFDRFRTENKTD